jgi:hypothetical protein
VRIRVRTGERVRLERVAVTCARSLWKRLSRKVWRWCWRLRLRGIRRRGRGMEKSARSSDLRTSPRSETPIL